jgi:F-type H+-transporting ATPase subunit gamma
MQITSAMKMVSAAKLKKAQDAITAMRPYAEQNPAYRVIKSG